MGEMKNAKFSWWRYDSPNMLFGCLACYSSPSATTVLAIEKNDGYNVFRSMGDLTLYKHAKKLVCANTGGLMKESARKAGIDSDGELEWRLLYCSDDTDINVQASDEIKDVFEHQKLRYEVVVPSVFRGTTTKLYKCAVALSGGQGDKIARRICECAEEWSEYAKSRYPEWVAVKDTSCGPVWLEGFDAERISFGFLEFLTEALVLQKKRVSTNTCRVPKSEDVMKELQSMTGHLKAVERMLAGELFGLGNENGSKHSLTRQDLERFMFGGGLSKMFLSDGPRDFLALAARARGYWTTQVICRAGKMQIRFTNMEGTRIAQRGTELGDCSGFGIVRPGDRDVVMRISEECDMGARQGMMVFWKDMGDTTTREEMLDIFRNSMWNRDGKEMLLADTTIGGGVEKDSELQAQNVEKWFEDLRAFENGDAQRQYEQRGLELAEAERVTKSTDAWIFEVIEGSRQAGRRLHELRTRLGMEEEEEAEEGWCGGGG